MGQKTRAGFFRKVGKDIEVLDPPRAPTANPKASSIPAVAEILALKNPGEKFAKLRAHPHPQAQFLWAIFRDLFHYAAFHLADDRRQRARRRPRAALGLRLGDGPVRALAGGGLEGRGRVARGGHRGRQGACERAAAEMGERGSRGSGRAHGGGRVERVGRDVPAALDAAGLSAPGVSRTPCWASGGRPGTTIMETPAVRLWHLGDDIGIVSFKSKANTIGEDVLDGIQAAIERAERECAGLVLWQTKEPFSLGANLAAIEPAIKAGQWSVIEAVVAKFQQTSLRLRYSLVPTVAAVRGMALGGSCEFILHCDRTVAALESYIGLVEAGVGLLPGGGGCKEIAVRAAQEVARGAVGSQLDQLPFLRTYFQTVAMAKVSRSASEAKEMGFLRPADPVVFNAFEAAARRAGDGAGACGSRVPAAACRRATFRSPAAPGSRRSR